MKLIQKIKNKIEAITLPFFLAMPKPEDRKPQLTTKDDTKEELSDISEEEAIKFTENCIEYNPESKAKMITYYQDDRNSPKKAYIIGQVGTRLDLDSRDSLGNGFKVKRKT